MSLRRKISAILSAVVCGYLVLCAWVVDWAILDPFARLEDKMVGENLARVDRAIQGEVDAVTMINLDFSPWDETYEFLQGNRPAYIEENFAYSNWMQNLGIDVIAFYDRDGNLRWGGVSGGSSDTFLPVDGLLNPKLAPVFPLINHRSVSSQKTGLLPTSRNDILAFASFPVLTSDKKGPVVGAVFTGRFLDKKAIDRISEHTRVGVELNPLSNPGVAGGAVDYGGLENTWKTNAVGENLRSSKLLRDVYGQPVAALKATTPADISAMGEKTVVVTLVALSSAGLVTFLAMAFLLQRLVLSPIAKLDRHMASIEASGDLSKRIASNGKDEIGTLANRFDRLTDRLETSHGEMVEARDTALEVSRLKSEFLAAMSHEIRTPMNGVMGMTELLLSSALDDRQRRFARTVHKSAESLLGIINDILDFSKIEAGKLEFESLDFDMRELLEDTAFMFSESTNAKGIELMVFVPPDCEVCVVGDQMRIRQILVNLIGNAVKFTSEGRIVIRSFVLQEGNEESLFRIEVEDTGIGIPSDKQKLVFESFSQADGSTTRKFGGSGLGLTISRQLVEMMGGQIGVKSTQGKGSTFWIDLPLQHGSCALMAPQSQLDMMEGVRALIVDDSDTNCEILENQLAAWGLRCDSCFSGEQALGQLRAAAKQQDPFRLLLLDLDMPGMDGLECAQLISSDPKIPAMPTALLSSVAIEGTERLVAGLDDHLTKPIRQSELFDCLTRLLGTRPDASDNKSDQHEAESKISTLRILLVEDNEVNQLVAQEMLRQLRMEADIASDGLEALEVMSSKTFDLVLMDCHMPGLDGFETTRKIRELEMHGGQRTTVVAMTANASTSDRQDCLDAGMDDYISKPFSQGQLQEVIQNQMQGRREAAADRLT